MSIRSQLLGTCKSLNELLTDDEMNDPTLLADIDAEIWLCEGCHWWVEVSETDEDGYCEDCQ